MPSRTKLEKRQFQRIVPEGNHPISVDISGENFLEITQAADISLKGIGFQSPNGLKGCTMGDIYTAVVRLPHPIRRTIKFKGRIKHISDSLFGMAYEQITPKNKEYIAQYIDYRLNRYANPVFRFIRHFSNYRKAVAFTVICLLIPMLFWLNMRDTPRPTPPAVTSAQAVAKPPEKRLTEKADQVSPADAKPAVETSLPAETVAPSTAATLQIGTLTIEGRYGRTLLELSTAVTKAGWIALPVQFCYGGYDWKFTLPAREGAVPIEGGIWRNGDTIGLWQLKENRGFDSLDLKPWARNETVGWVGRTTETPLPITLSETDIENQFGYFTSISLPTAPTESGFLIQNGHLVGWTFENMPGQLFFWTGAEGERLFTEINVDSFYDITFANSREEKFSEALAATPDRSLADSLRLFAEAFRLTPALPDRMRANHLKNEYIFNHIGRVVDGLTQNGDYRSIADILDDPYVLAEVNEDFLPTIVNATAKAYGNARAVALAESLEPRLTDSKNQLKTIYTNWIGEFIGSKNLQGWHRALDVGLNRYPKDARMHLLEVELAIAEERWQDAESLLNEREYPASLQDKALILAGQIAENNKKTRGIRLPVDPASGAIRATVLLNDRVTRRALLDTGASMITISRSTADLLGIEITPDTPKRYVQTAGGIRLAHEVTIQAITLDKYTVQNVDALVIGNTGAANILLGLNFLNHFDLELDNTGGFIYLYPR